MSDLFDDRDLTEGARSVLDDYLRSYTESIMRSARSKAVRASGLSSAEVSVRDVVEAIEETTDPGPPHRYRRRRIERLRLFVSIYAMLGVVMMAVGLAYYVTAQEDLTSAERIGLLLGATGFTLSLLSGAFALILQRRGSGDDRTASRYDDLAGEFIREWANFETVGSRLVADTAGESRVEAVPLRELLRLSDKYDLVPRRDQDFLLEMLDTRNRIVHSNAPYTGPQAREDLDRLSAIVARMSMRARR